MIKRIITSLKVRIRNKLNPKSELEILRERGLIYGRNFNFLIAI